MILDPGNFRIFGTGGGTKSLEETSCGDGDGKYFRYLIGNTTAAVGGGWGMGSDDK